MKKKFAMAAICLSIVIGFQNCNQKALTSNYGTFSNSVEESSSVGSEADGQTNVALDNQLTQPSAILNTQEVIASLDRAQPGESCDGWLQRNGVAAEVKNAFHTYDGVESKWGQGGVNENKACAMMIYSSLNRSWSCTAGSSSHIDQFDTNPAFWSYPVVSCNDGVRSVRTAFSGFTALSDNQ